jgi:hypothetical protein
VLSVRDLYDPSRLALEAGAAGESPELQIEELFRELWSRRHGEAPDEETVAELMSALLSVNRDQEASARPERESGG